jgi:Cu+-exporting ATPase
MGNVQFFLDNIMVKNLIAVKTTCFHCGDKINLSPIQFDDKQFCCQGCQGVYELLSQSNLCDYYAISDKPGLAQKNPVSKVKFAYLEDEEIQKQLIDFKDQKVSRITFHVSTMHCSSCIWLLESLYKIDKGIGHCRVDFLKKQLSISFNHNETSLRKIVELLSSLGYEPSLSLSHLEQTKKVSNNNQLLYQVGVAGFCFGNIMLISFPEYFGLDSLSHKTFSSLFGYLNMGLALPVFLYSAQSYFVSAYQSLRKGIINIDFPLALGILVMFIRSSYEVISHSGIGFFDTLAGLVFFLLIGKWVQQRTFDTLSFERDYKSYFPVAVSVLKEEKELTVPVTKLKVGDRMLIRNQEIIPADAILLNGEAKIDFSFVTGESSPVDKVLGEMIYAGGRQTGAAIELEVCKPVSQSYLTQLWNSAHFTKDRESQIITFQSVVSRYFTFALLGIAITAAIFWLLFDPSRILAAFTAVLIIACPCALALSSPFALGNALRMFGRAKFYLKSPEVIEQMAKTNHIVFDKTGTITNAAHANISFIGSDLTKVENEAIFNIANNSVHPLSKKIASYLNSYHSGNAGLSSFKEVTGSGVSAFYGRIEVKLGAAHFLGIDGFESDADVLASYVGVSINKSYKGFFKISHAYREGLKEVIDSLALNSELSLLSGDNNAEEARLKAFFPKNSSLMFKQSPSEKLLFINQLKENGQQVVMIGDGLNDAGALKAANIGISVTEDTANFSPSSDVIMDAKVFNQLPKFFQYAKDTVKVIRMSFVVSLLYNLVGLSFAVTGTMSPIVAAILMPLSSISVISFTTAATWIYAKKRSLLQ